MLEQTLWELTSSSVKQTDSMRVGSSSSVCWFINVLSLHLTLWALSQPDRVPAEVHGGLGREKPAGMWYYINTGVIFL